MAISMERPSKGDMCVHVARSHVTVLAFTIRTLPHPTMYFTPSCHSLKVHMDHMSERVPAFFPSSSHPFHFFHSRPEVHPSNLHVFPQEPSSSLGSPTVSSD